MNFNKIAVASMMIFGATTLANAADPVTVQGGTVHFEGELVNAACAVSTGSSNLVVNLNQHRTALLKKAGDASPEVPFQIELVDCDKEIQATASIAFSGTGTLANPALLATSAGGGNATIAKNVGIEISDRTSGVMKIDGSTFSTKANLINGVNKLDFTARYVATGEATAGAAHASATFLVHYE